MVKVIVKHPHLIVDNKVVEYGSEIEVEQSLADSLLSRKIVELAPHLEVATPKPKRKKQ